jgi:hypothetical protein
MSVLSRITESVANWYRGKYIPPIENDPESSVVVISFGYYVQPPLAKILGAVSGFIAAEWKWLLGFLVAVSGVVVAALKLFR